MMRNRKSYARIYTVEYRRGDSAPWYQREYSRDAKSDFTEDIRFARRMTWDDSESALLMARRSPALEARRMIVPHDWPEGAKKMQSPR